MESDKSESRAAGVAIEALEGRQYLSWGTFPRLINQDVAVSSYPNIVGTGETIAILDSGVNYNDPVLGGGFGAGFKVVDGYDFVDHDTDPMDEDGHGTGVATLAAGGTYTYNGQTYQGVAPGARIVALRIDDGSGNISDATYTAALQWVLDHQAEYNIVAVNISEGGNAVFDSPTTQNSPYSGLLAQLENKKVMVAISSGNDGLSLGEGVEYPSADPSAFAIGGIESSDAIWSLTSRGHNLDLLAPGLNVPTVYINEDHEHIVLQATGTSFSCPFVAGAAALLRQVNPILTPDEIMGILQTTGHDVYDSGTQLTFKRINLAAAISSATQGVGGQAAALSSITNDNSIAFAKNGTLYLSYYDSGSGDLMATSRAASGGWSATQIVDQTGNVGKDSSILVDHNGNAGIAYYDVANGDLKYAHYNGSIWKVLRVDGSSDVGLHASLAFDASNRPAISYYDNTHKTLKFAYWNGTKFVVSTLDSTAAAGRSSSVAWNPTAKTWAVGYESHAHGQFIFAQQASSKTPAVWKKTIVDHTSLGGGQLSVAFGPKAQPAFSYYDATTGKMKFAQASGTTWKVGFLSSSRSATTGTTLFFDSTGANIVYFDATYGRVILADGSIGKWTYFPLLTNTASMISVAQGPSDQVDFTFLQTDSDSLHLLDVP